MQGIEHMVAPEQGMIRPGMVVICGDSHTTTYGALGALGFGIGTSEVEHVLATQALVYRMAQDMRIRVDGQLPPGTTSKDLVLMIIAAIGAQGARGFVVEYCGTAIECLSVGVASIGWIRRRKRSCHEAAAPSPLSLLHALRTLGKRIEPPSQLPWPRTAPGRHQHARQEDYVQLLIGHAEVVAQTTSRSTAVSRRATLRRQIALATSLRKRAVL